MSVFFSIIEVFSLSNKLNKRRANKLQKKLYITETKLFLMQPNYHLEMTTTQTLSWTAILPEVVDSGRGTTTTNHRYNQHESTYIILHSFPLKDPITFGLLLYSMICKMNSCYIVLPNNKLMKTLFERSAVSCLCIF